MPDPRLGRLAGLFDWAGLTILDVGARGGPLPWVERLAPWSRYVACEPQADAVVDAPAPTIWRERIVVREALAAQEGPVTLNVTANGGFTSVLKPDQDLAQAYCLVNEMAEVGTAQVPAITLAQAAERYGFGELGFVKLDTQGSELDILRSGEALITGPVQAIFIECEFRPFYQGQPLFAEIDIWLRERGFDLIALEPTSRRRRKPGSRVAYSKPEIAWAHALYVKATPGEGEPDALKHIIRQIAVAMAYDYFDLAADRLAEPRTQALLAAAGLAAGPEDVAAFVAAALGPEAEKQAVDVVRHRIPLQSRDH